MTTSTGAPTAELADRGHERVGRALAGRVTRRLGLYLLTSVLTSLLALPALWLALPRFQPRRTLSMSASGFLAHNARRLLADPEAVGALRLAVLVAGVVVLLSVGCAVGAACALPRARRPGRDLALYLTLLLCSVAAGVAATMPLFLLLHDLSLMDGQLSVTLVLSGGLLPAALFLLKDLVDALPYWNAQAARAFGPRRLVRVLARLTSPLARRGVVLVVVMALVNVWGCALASLSPLAGDRLSPDQVVMYTLSTGGGGPDPRLVATFTVLYSALIVGMYLLAGRRYGFRPRGGWRS